MYSLLYIGVYMYVCIYKCVYMYIYMFVCFLSYLILSKQSFVMIPCFVEYKYVRYC